MALNKLLSTILGRQPETRERFEENSPLGMPVSSGIQAYLSNWAETGRYITPDVARSSPSVHACTMLISQSIARMEWRILLDVDGHQEPIKEHPLYALLNHEPNQCMGALTWRQSMLLDCLLYGNGYSFIERDSSGRPIRLEKLRPDLMTAMRAPDNSVVYAYAAGTTGARTFAAYDMFHLIGPSSDGLIGEPPIYLARQLIGIEIEAESFVASFFQNGARPAGVLQVQGQLSPEAFGRLKESWQAMQGGARNAGRVAILESGYEFKQISVNPEDAQLIELRRYCREQIAAVFGVPPHMIGDAGKQSYSSAEQSDIEFTKHTLGTWASRLEEEAHRKLIRVGERVATSISFDALTRGDMPGRFGAYATALTHGFLTINEIRAREGLAPVQGGENIRAPLNLGPLPLKATEPSDAPSGADATAQGVGQLQALTTLAAAVAKGDLPAAAASGIIAAAFPMLALATIQAIIDPLIQAATKPPAPAPSATPPTSPPTGQSPPQVAPAPPKSPTSDSPTSSAEVGETDEARDCGTGAGGFQPGNACGGGGSGGGGSDSSSPTDRGIPNASDLKTMKNLGGSTGAILAQDADGNQFVVKEGNSPEHIRSESAANDIYAAAGVPVPAHKLDESDPASPKQITKFVDGKPLGDVKGEAFETAAAALREDFAADALVANWDVVGMSRDNVLVPNDGGPPMRVDNGGSLEFRAQGGDKNFGAKVGELETLRTSDQGRAIFGKLTDGQISKQIERLSSRREAIIGATPPKLQAVMGQRLDYMEQWAKDRRSRDPNTLTLRIITDSDVRAVVAKCVASKVQEFRELGYSEALSLTYAEDYCGESEDRDCGTGSGGFQPGNTCGGGGGGGGGGGSSDPSPSANKKAGAWMNKKGYPSEYIETAGEAKLYQCLVAKGMSNGMSKSEASEYAVEIIRGGAPEDNAVVNSIGKSFGIDMESLENQTAALTLKNDPGIYAKEKAIAAGLIKPAASGSQANVPPLQAAPTAPPAQQVHAAPAPSAPPLNPFLEPAKQAEPTKAGPSATPGIPPIGQLPVGSPKDWKDSATPKVTEAQQKAVEAVPLARAAVYEYSGSGYGALNKNLRDIHSLNANGEAKGLNDLSKLTVNQALMVGALDVVTRIDQRDPPPAVVFRGVRSDTVIAKIDSLGVGQSFVDHGFGSTSTELSTAESFGSSTSSAVVMRISTRQGIPINAWSQAKGEAEVLLPRGSRFVMRSKEWRYVGGQKRLYVELEHTETN